MPSQPDYPEKSPAQDSPDSSHTPYVSAAESPLEFSAKAVAYPIEKTVVSAMHNLAGQFDHPVEPSEMAIREIFVDEGRTMYRIRPRAQGRAYRIRKRSSIITVIVDYRGDLEKKKK